MNAPPYPEPVSGGLLPQGQDAPLLQAAPTLRRFAVVDAPGFAIEVSDAPEAVYLLGRPDGREVPVPCRVCGTWNPAVLSGRHFFLSHEPDVALQLTSVRLVTHHIGRLAFPSGWSASPWFAASSRRVLLRRLQAFTTEFVGEQLIGSPALSRAIAREERR